MSTTRATTEGGDEDGLASRSQGGEDERGEGLVADEFTQETATVVPTQGGDGGGGLTQMSMDY